MTENYDIYLQQLYGNYMKLSPVEQRIAHLKVRLRKLSLVMNEIDSVVKTWRLIIDEK